MLVTGGTGSFGRSFAKYLSGVRAAKVIIFSRDEMKQLQMSRDLGGGIYRYFIGDVRDRERLYRAFRGVDVVVHAAATKIVPTAEYNPFESVKTNIHGAMNVVDAAIDCGVKKVIALSTDKASGPVNLYGATKLVSDKLFIASSAYDGVQNTVFTVVRYGNVMGSRGSIIPLFTQLAHTGVFPITDLQMSRFMIPMSDAIALVEKAASVAKGGEIFVKKLPSMWVRDIAAAVDNTAKLEITGIRPGEKLHEQMIGIEDAAFTREFDDHFRIYSPLNRGVGSESLLEGKEVSPNFSYSSQTNDWWWSPDQLREWLATNLGSISDI